MNITALNTARLTKLACLIFLARSPFTPSDAFAQLTVTTAMHAFPDGGRSFSNGGAGMGTNGIIFDNVLGQTFTAEETGVLFDISFIATRLSETTDADLRIDIADFASGQPGDLLGSVYIPAQEFETGFLSGNPDTFNKTASFANSKISIITGEQYAFLLSTDVTEANYRIYGDTSSYVGGNWIRSQNGSPFSNIGSTSDLFFRVNLNSVPEPSSMAAVAVLSILQLLRRNNR